MHLQIFFFIFFLSVTFLLLLITFHQFVSATILLIFLTIFFFKLLLFILLFLVHQFISANIFTIFPIFLTIFFKLLLFLMHQFISANIFLLHFMHQSLRADIFIFFIPFLLHTPLLLLLLCGSSGLRWLQLSSRNSYESRRYEQVAVL